MSLNVAIAGLGVTGGSLRKYLEKKTDNNLLEYDPPLGLNTDISEADVVFICVPCGTKGMEQDTSTIESIISMDYKKNPIFLIRSTVVPYTCDKLAKKYNKEVYFTPEFLTERVALEDQMRMDIATGIPFHKNYITIKLFPDKRIINCTNLEAEIAKYAHNICGAIQVTYWNMIAEICRTEFASWKMVGDICKISGYMNETYMSVPGHDNRMGYGGKCYPPNVEDFKNWLKKDGNNIDMELLLKTVQEYNYWIRGEI